MRFSPVMQGSWAVALASLVCVYAGMLPDSAVASAGSRIVLGPPFGSFARGTGVTVDQGTGNVYVVDGGGHEEIRVFGGEGGAPVGGGPSSFNGSLSPSKAFSFKFEPAGPAYDSKNKVVYFPDVQNNLVDKYRLNGSNEYEFVCEITGAGQSGEACSESGGSPPMRFREPLGVAVDPAGDVYVANYRPAGIWEYNAAGEQVAEISTKFGHPQFLAVTRTGTIYAIQYGNGPVWELKRRSPTGAVEKETELPGAEATGIAFDQATGDLIVDRGGSIEEFNAKREVVNTTEGVLNSGTGIAVNETTNHVYAVQNGGENMVILGAPSQAAPSISGEQASSLSPTSVRLAARVNPDGDETNCQFEYIEDTAYQAALAAKAPNPYAAGASVACSPATLEARFTPVRVEATLSALSPGVTYDYRTVAGNAFKGASTTDGGNVAFTMPAASPPEVNTEPAQYISDNGALLTGAINPEGLATIYEAQYGTTTTYGSSAPAQPLQLGAGNTERGVDVAIAHLTPGTTYHYRLLATNTGGTTYGQDQTFTTTGGAVTSTFTPFAIPSVPLIEPTPIAFPATKEGSVVKKTTHHKHRSTKRKHKPNRHRNNKTKKTKHKSK